MNQGYLCLILHSHLPYVRHPEYDNFLEEDWLYEAITETYIPLILIFEKLLEDGVDFHITISMSPSLISMLTDDLLKSRYSDHLDKLVELAYKEVERTRTEPKFQKVSAMYLKRFVKIRQTYRKYSGNIVLAFKKLQDLGKIEIITCGATHGFFPLMDVCKPSVRAQLKVAVEHYEKVFGRKPRGIWLPECGYIPGLDEILREVGLKYFFVDSHGILHGSPRPKYGVFAPVYCKSGVACFGRDMESSKQVWSSAEGYPGNQCYREFYRDIGFDLDFDYIKPYIHSDGIKKNTGIKYYRITGNGNYKEPYIPEKAMEKAAEHAGNFMLSRQKQIEYLNNTMGKKPIIISPYDAELFGHWWFEGPNWLEFLIRKVAYDQDIIKMVTPSQYLEENSKNQVVAPSMSSWGWKGYSEVWLQGTNDWVYKHLHKASERMTELVGLFPETNGKLQRALKQALRELLLAQSSDWAFIMATGTHVDYAVKRTKTHINRFNRLYESIKMDDIDENWLGEIENKDNIFPEIDYKVHQ